MTIPLDEADLELQAVARSYVQQRDLRGQARTWLDVADAPLPAFWGEIASMGWLGLHLPEEVGGSGAGLLQTAVVLAELGAAVAPGPVLSTLVVSATLGALAPSDPLLGDLASGAVRGAVGLDTELAWTETGTISGTAGVVLGADVAELLLLVIGEDAVLVDAQSSGVGVAAVKTLDPTQRCARVELEDVIVTPGRRLEGAGRHVLAVARALAAAQAVGGAAACLDMAVAYAKLREQFGRPIATFQAIKHHCADMVVAVELSESVAWDAARSLTAGPDERAELAAAVAATQALPHFVRNAQTNMQVHGGIGFTWEHDAHIYLRRALGLTALLGDRRAAADVSRLMAAGVERPTSIDLPDSVQPMRAEAKALAERIRDLPDEEQRAALIASGFSMPHLPAPWGRALGAADQIAVAEELDGTAEPDYGVGAWVIPTIIQHATQEQLARWVAPSLSLDLVWCQMFSEPEAGSDAASITTRGVRVEGGWKVTGQKVWTSRAQSCSHGIATVRTSVEERKQAGITMMVLDLHALGVLVRPLREASDEFGFGEVFLDDVFVPDVDVLGAVGDGWAVARSTLGNERVAVGSTRRFGGGVIDLVRVYREVVADDPGAAVEIGAVLAEGEALALLTTRAGIRAVLGLPPGREGAITKLVRAANTQHSAELALRLIGPEAALVDGSAVDVAKSVVKSRMMSIGGGTTEIVKNIIAERVLGMPRDPALS